MTAFAELIAMTNDRVIEFLSDVEADFGAGGIVSGIFRDPPAEAFGMIEGSRPTFEATESALAMVHEGDAVTISGTDYLVADRRAFAGIVTLTLGRA